LSKEECLELNRIEKTNTENKTFEELYETKLLENKNFNIEQKQKQKTHKSVALEYCHAIKNGDLKNIKDLKKMLTFGVEKTFFDITDDETKSGNVRSELDDQLQAAVEFKEGF